MTTATPTRETVLADVRKFTAVRGKFTSDYWYAGGKFDRDTVAQALGTSNAAGVNAVLIEMKRAGHDNDSETIQNIVKRYRATVVTPRVRNEKRPHFRNLKPAPATTRSARDRSIPAPATAHAAHARRTPVTIKGVTVSRPYRPTPTKMELATALVAYNREHGTLHGYYESEGAYKPQKVYTILGSRSLKKLERMIMESDNLSLSLGEVAHLFLQSRIDKQVHLLQNA